MQPCLVDRKFHVTICLPLSVVVVEDDNGDDDDDGDE